MGKKKGKAIAFSPLRELMSKIVGEEAIISRDAIDFMREHLIERAKLMTSAAAEVVKYGKRKKIMPEDFVFANKVVASCWRYDPDTGKSMPCLTKPSVTVPVDPKLGLEATELPKGQRWSGNTNPKFKASAKGGNEYLDGKKNPFLDE